jgi:hypothetical protein
MRPFVLVCVKTPGVALYEGRRRITKTKFDRVPYAEEVELYRKQDRAFLIACGLDPDDEDSAA